jgi:hypothetical protein
LRQQQEPERTNEGSRRHWDQKRRGERKKPARTVGREGGERDLDSEVAEVGKPIGGDAIQRFLLKHAKANKKGKANEELGKRGKTEGVDLEVGCADQHDDIGALNLHLALV